jgi:TRAP-type C4-dicarboxylate transport system permease small subunit
MQTNVQSAPSDSVAERAFAAVERAAVAVAGAAIVAAGALIVAGVALRYFGQPGIPDAELFVRDLMIVACIVPLAVVAGRRGHIAVDLVVRRFPPRVARRIDAATAVLSFGFLVPIVWSGVQNLATAWTRDSYYDGALELPEWPGRLVFLIGFALFFARSLHRLVTDARTGPSARD